MAGIEYPSYATQTLPAWVGDFLDQEHLMPAGGRLDASAFNAPMTVTLTAGAAAGSTTLAVAALTGDIPAGVVLNFAGTKMARLTAFAKKGATSLTVAPLAGAVLLNDAAAYSGPGTRSVPSGTVVGRTYAERASGGPFGPAADTDDEVFIVAFSVEDVSRNQDVDLVRPGEFVVKENLLPGTITAAVLTKLRGLYVCVYGKPT